MQNDGASGSGIYALMVNMHDELTLLNPFVLVLIRNHIFLDA